MSPSVLKNQNFRIILCEFKVVSIILQSHSSFFRCPNSLFQFAPVAEFFWPQQAAVLSEKAVKPTTR